MIAASSVLKTRSDVRYRVVDRKAIVIRQQEGEVVVLNEVGARVLDLVRSGAPVRGVIDVMAGEFEVGRAELERDVLAFVGQLLDDGILEEVAG